MRMSEDVLAEARVLADDRNAVATAADSNPPHTTLVLACYRVERYLPAFLKSLDAQTADHFGYELIFVIDGCPEGSERVVRRWAEHCDYQVRIVVQENGGVAAARNTGFARARGAWISSPDPDDRLDSNYLAEIEAARVAFPDESMFVGRIRLQSPEGQDVRHPLDFKYVSGERRVVDLSETPDDIQTLGGTVFFDAERIAAHGQRVRRDLPTASDADFIMRYLLLNGARYVLVPSAEYLYQRRADDSSIVKTQEANIARFTTVFGVTHRSLLDAAGSECPQWLANTLLYFTFYLFRRNHRADSPVYSTSDWDLREIRAELAENLRRIGGAGIERFRIFDVPLEIRMAWLAAAQPDRRRSPVERLHAEVRGSEIRVGFYSPDLGQPEALEAVGAEIVEAKTRRVEYLGGIWLHQHLLLLKRAPGGEAVAVRSGGAFDFELGGVPLPAAEIRRELGQQKPAAPPVQSPPRPAGSRGMSLIDSLKRLRFSAPLRLARMSGYSKRFSAACVFSETSGDSPWLTALCGTAARDSSNGVNAWLVVEQGDNRRANGVRTVRRGSVRHFILMKHARAVVSTGFALSERQPFPPEMLSKHWRFIYAPAESPAAREYRRLNPAPIDAIVAGDAEEEALYAGDGGDYRFFPSEVVVLPGLREGAVDSSIVRAALSPCLRPVVNG